MFYLLLTAHAALSIGTNGGEVLAAAGVRLFGDMAVASGLEIPLVVSPPVIDRYLSLNPFVRLRDLPGIVRFAVTIRDTQRFKHHFANDKRREPRHFFIATVELLEADAQARSRARTGDLSMHGCYVDTLNPVPVPSKVKVTVTHNEESFIALDSVAHAEPNIGMDISFTEMERNQKEILLKWLAASGS